VRALAGHPDHDPAGTQRPGRHQRTGQYQVRRPGQQHLVLDAARLALGGVHHDQRMAPAALRGLGHRGQLAGERERRAATATQVDLAGPADQLGLGQRWGGAEGGAVAGQIQAAGPVQASR